MCLVEIFSTANMCLVEIFSTAKRSSTLGARILLNSQPNRAISTPMVVRTNCGQLLRRVGAFSK